MHRVVSDYTGVETSSGNVKVFVRARPPEEASNSDFLETNEDCRKIVIKDPDSTSKKYSEVAFQFDRIFWTDKSQKEVFDVVCVPQVDHVLGGFNCCSFAYGQTGSGKTYTMFGEDGEVRGLIPRSVEYLFESLARRSHSHEIALVCSFLEIYNDTIRDLGKAYLVAMGAQSSTSAALFSKTSDLYSSLAEKRGNSYFAPAFRKPGSAGITSEVEKDRPGMKTVSDEYAAMNYEIREDVDGTVFVKDLSLIPVTTIDEVMSLINMGLRVRATHETKMNAVSSRSHTVFTVTVLQKDKVSGQTLSGMLNLVDLAGSERLNKSQSQGIRLKEMLHINTSLTALGKVVMALDPNAESSHIPYRDTKLTRILQNSLGGNSYTSVLAAIHPIPYHYDECLSTLQFANRCRNVMNNPRVNYLGDSEDKDRKIKRLTEELNQTRQRIGQLESSTMGIGGGSGGVTARSHQRAVTPAQLVQMLRKLGIDASLSPEGGLIVEGRKVDNAELQMDSILGASAEGSIADDGSVLTARSTQGKKSHAHTPSYEKIKKQLGESESANKLLKASIDEKKKMIEGLQQSLVDANLDVTKYQMKITHQKHEHDQFATERDNFVRELKQEHQSSREAEMNKLVQRNNLIMKEQDKLLLSYPESVVAYTDLLRKAKLQKDADTAPLRKAFETKFAQLEKSRVAELTHTKQQYEFWLRERDERLEKFVNNFNEYRQKKRDNLRTCEKEIICLYEYSVRLEEILHDVEWGKYPIQQRQGTGGRPTTGAAGTGVGTKGALQNYGGVVLPKGIKPTNPLTTALLNAKCDNENGIRGITATTTVLPGHQQASGSHAGYLELSRKLLKKHLERQNTLSISKVDRAPAPHTDALLNPTSYSYASYDNNHQFSYTSRAMSPTSKIVANNPDINGEMQQHIRNLLNSTSAPVPSVPLSNVVNATRGVVRPHSGGHVRSATRQFDARNQSKNSESSVLVQPPIVAAPSGRRTQSANSVHRMTSSAAELMVNPDNGFVSLADRDILATNEVGQSQELSESRGESVVEEGVVSVKSMRRQKSLNEQKAVYEDVISRMKEEIDFLTKEQNAEKLRLEEVVEQLKSNETWKYMKHLEEEQEHLHGQIKDLSSQLQIAKVANASLNRLSQKKQNSVGR